MEYIIPIVSIEALGDWSFTKFISEGKKNIFYKLLGYLSYIGVLEMFQSSIQQKGLAWTNTAWDGFSNIFTGAVAVLYFKERPSLKEWAGILLVIVGIFLLGTDGIKKYPTKP
jgi:multidrug transporter EmrE-like cation transporter